MAYIKVLKDEELVGGVSNTDVYPVTTSQALYRQNPDGTVPAGIKHQKLEESLQDIETDAKELHRKAEKLTVSLSNDKVNQTLEITGEINSMNLLGGAVLETFGDEPSKNIAPEEMTAKRLQISSSGAILFDQPVFTTGFILPNVVGTYISKFTCRYNNIIKDAVNTVNVNLRKYFGFADSQPTDVTALAVNHFSNSVECTVTIPASGTGFKNIWFAIPNGMTISRIVQPDALNAPLVFTQVGTVQRTIGGNSYTYKLYKSTDLVDSSVNKQLTIS